MHAIWPPSYVLSPVSSVAHDPGYQHFIFEAI